MRESSEGGATGAQDGLPADQRAGAVAVPGAVVSMTPEIDALLARIVECDTITDCKPETAVWLDEHGGLFADNDVGLLIDKARELEAAVNAMRAVLTSFAVMPPDADGIVWLHVSCRAKAMFNLGKTGLLAVQVMEFLEEERCLALRAAGVKA